MIDYDSHRWRDHFFDVRGSMVREIGYRALVCTVTAVIITAIHHRWHEFESTGVVHGLVGAALSLLLVFRTNASYDRFWEARKLWGSIVNESRNLARTVSVLLSDAPERARHVIRLGIAFPVAAMNQLRGARGLGPIGDELDPAVSAALRDAQHPPLAIACAITRTLADARRDGVISDIQQSMIDQNVQVLIDCIGACERIRKTPLPFAYVVHLRRALMIYCCTLPLALLEDFGWWTIVVTFLVAYVLLGIEEIGVEIEEPFGTDENDLPLDLICRTIEGNLRALLPETETVTP